MKTIKGKLKLNEFSKNELDQRKLNALKGGKCVCDSGCSSSCDRVLETWGHVGMYDLFLQGLYSY